MPILGTACSTKDEPKAGDDEMTIIVPEITGETPYKTISLGNNAQTKVGNNNQFAIDLFKAATAEDANNNVCIAPITSITGLAMLATGDNNAARDEILTKLGYTADEKGLNDLKEFCRIMNQELPVLDKETACRPANSLWLNKGLKVLPNYSSSIRDIFSAEVFSTNLYSEEGKDLINKWCEIKTTGLIPNFLEEPFNTDVALISALYFNGTWTEPFDKDASYEGIFDNIKGYGNVVYMEKNFKDASYYSDSKLEALSLPYGNGNFRMTFVLPKKAVAFNETAKAFSATDYDNIARFSTKKEKIVTIPRFEAHTKSNHLEIYKNLGFKKIFSPGITGILENSTPLSVSKILHETIIKVTEDGTEAAGVNGIGMDIAASGDEQLTDLFFTLDRPFFYIIEEASTNTILFIGQIVKL